MSQETTMDNVEMIVDDEARVKEELERCKIQAETIAMQRYSDAEKMKFAKIIREFNALYWKLKEQTWCNTKWRGVPVCKPPTDLWIYQELITAVEPDLIIETGTLAGGSALFMHDTMQLNKNYGWIISIDTETSNIYETAKTSLVKFLHGSSTDAETVAFVKAHIASYECQKVMVILDSNHEAEHVLQELRLYAPLVSVGSALIVEDTNNHPGPKAAVEEWFSEHEETGMKFRPDYMCEKFMLTFNRNGYYERVK